MAISITDDLLVNLETHQRTALVNAVTSLVNARIFGSSVLTKADGLSGWNEGPPQGIATWLRLAESRVRNAAAHFNKEKLATLALVNDCDERDREALVETMERMDRLNAECEALESAIQEATTRYAELEAPRLRLWRTHALYPAKTSTYRHGNIPSADESLTRCLEALESWGQATGAAKADPSKIGATFNDVISQRQDIGHRAAQRLATLRAMEVTVNRSHAALRATRTPSVLHQLTVDRAHLKTALDEGRLSVIEALECDVNLLQKLTGALYSALIEGAASCPALSVREAAWGKLKDLCPSGDEPLQAQTRALRWVALMHAARVEDRTGELSKRLLSALADDSESSMEELEGSYLTAMRKTTEQVNQELAEAQRPLIEAARKTLVGRRVESQCPACDPKGQAQPPPEYVGGMLCPKCGGTQLVWRLALEGPPRRVEWLSEASALNVARTEATLLELKREADAIGYRGCLTNAVGLPRVVAQAPPRDHLSPEAAISRWRKGLEHHRGHQDRNKQRWALLGALLLSVTLGFTVRASLPDCALPEGMTRACVESLNPLTCAPTFQQDGLTCDDGDSRSAFDACDGAGQCVGCPQPNPHECIKARRPSAGSCVASFKSPGTKCDDELPHTRWDTCSSAGQCIGKPFECTTSHAGREPQCVQKAEHKNDDCALTYHPQGAECDDGEPDTKEDQCDGGGYCRGTSYTCEAQACQAESVPNGVDCTITPEDKGTKCAERRIEGQMVAILCDGSVEGRCDQVATCDGEDYVNAEALLDDDCDKRLNCSDYKAEEIKCRLCPADSRYGCDGKCYPVKWWGDGECDVFFNCSEAEWDNGVCPR